MLSMCNSPSHGVKIVMKCMHLYLCEKDGCLHTQNNSQLLLWDALQNHGTPSPHHLVQHPNFFWTWLDQNLVRKCNLKHCWSLNCLLLPWPWKSLSVVTATRKYLSGFLWLWSKTRVIAKKRAGMNQWAKLNIQGHPRSERWLLIIIIMRPERWHFSNKDHSNDKDHFLSANS